MNQDQAPETNPAHRHIIKWTDGQDLWTMDIRPGQINLLTTAPIKEETRLALANQWGEAYRFVQGGNQWERK